MGKYFIFDIAGSFLWCHECQDAQSSFCAKYQVLCQPDNDVCLSELRRMTEDPSRKLTMQTIRRCGNSDECNIDGTLTGRGKTLTIKTSCCETDMCNPPEASWSLKRKKPNGKMCPIYSSLQKDYPELDVVQCTGDETHCVNFTSLITEGSFSRDELLHGCAMESICEKKLIKEYRSASNQMLVKNDIVCSNGMTIMVYLHHLIIFYISALAVLRD
ncbi:phospholipase A2 inhibitor and Ly6/PLAUR domain-containing protein-like [Rana temporaria]|uniref:phospholipase A2 inhibitor and Ly6/PLAUR domain-containing protein-like n=1 Tax=Rana temporaria TaxID=8407 RepID=UPI001AAC58E2|nr:phospholipase A2 inhibitor and Ly6/PLAUR domain-containing protein-like [Rana temporaria]